MAKKPTETKQESTVSDAKTETTDIVTQAGSAVSTNVINVLDDAGAGSREDFSKADLKIPFMKILQDLSPEVKKRDATYVDGAEAGMFYEELSARLIDGDTGFVFIPCYFTRDVTEWKPNRGGLVAVHGTDESVFKMSKRNDKGEDVLANGNTLLLSYLYYGFFLDLSEEVPILEPLVLAYSKTASKHARVWNSQISNLREPMPNGERGTFTPAIFYYSYTIKTQVESSGENSWFVPKIQRADRVLALPSGEEIYLKAREFRKMCQEGSVTTDATTKSGDTDLPF